MLNLPVRVYARKPIIPAIIMVASLCLLSSVYQTAAGSGQNSSDYNQINSKPNTELKQEAIVQNISTVALSRQTGIYYNVQFEPGLLEAERNKLIEQLGGRLAGWIAPLNIASIAISTENVQQRSGDFTTGLFMPLLVDERPKVIQFTESDNLISSAYVPNDPDILDADRAYNFRLLELYDAWDSEQGDVEVVVAVVDTGVTLSHPEFLGRLWDGYDFVNNDAEPLDDHGHGTHVAGIVAGAIDNSLGTAGICPKCMILPVKVLDSANIGTWFTAAQGIVYAVDNGADIINLSLGAATPSSTIEAAINYARSKDVLVVGAAGNAGLAEPFYPAAYKSVLSVGATTSDDVLWDMSNHGATVDVTAPGELIFNVHPDTNNNYGGFTFKSGTSMASPHVAGLAGLLLSQDSTRDTDELKRIILTTTDDLGNGGWDSTYGYGRINAASALRYGQSIMSGLATPKTSKSDLMELYIPAIIGY